MRAKTRDHQGLRGLPDRGNRKVPALYGAGAFRVAAPTCASATTCSRRTRSSSRPAARFRRQCSRASRKRDISTAIVRWNSDAPPRIAGRSGRRLRRREFGQFFARIGVPDDDGHPVGSAALGRRHRRRHGTHRVLPRRGNRVVETDAAVQRVTVARDGRKSCTSSKTASRNRSPRTRSSTRSAACRTSRSSIWKRRACRYHPVLGVGVDATLRTSQPDIFAVGDVTGRYHARARRDPTGRDRGAQRDSQRRTKSPTTASRRPTRSSPTRRSPSSARPRKNCRSAGTAVPACEHAVRRPRKSDRDRQDQGVREDAGRAARRPHPRCRILGPHASDLIHEVIVAMYFGATVFDFAKIPHLHPTLAEILTYPAEDAQLRADRRGPRRSRWRQRRTIERPSLARRARSDEAAQRAIRGNLRAAGASVRATARRRPAGSDRAARRRR